MENIVYFPLAGKRDSYRERGDDFLDLEGTVIFVIQLLRGSAHSDVAPAEHHPVPYLECWGFLPRWVRISPYSFLCFFQPFSGFVVHGVHPMGVYFAGRVERLRRRWVHGHRVKAVVSVEWGHTVSRCDRVVVCELRHWQQSYPVVLFLANECSEIGLDHLVEPFCLSVCLRVECCRHPGPNSREPQKLLCHDVTDNERKKEEKKKVISFYLRAGGACFLYIHCQALPAQSHFCFRQCAAQRQLAHCPPARCCSGEVLIRHAAIQHRAIVSKHAPV